jgi:hypothetical protein
MAKMTLLEMTQDILNDMDSDNVNSIDDTVESAQVAQIVKTTYFRIASQRDWSWLRSISSLTGLADTNNPTKMLIPATVNKVLWVKYNKKDVCYMDPKSFKDMIDMRTVQADVVDANGYVINRDPLYWTTYDDTYIHFDGYDLDVESTLQTSKAVIYAVTAPTWTHNDSFTPTMPEKFFPVLLSDAKGTAFLALKQQANAKEERIAKVGHSRMQNESWRVDDGESKTNTDVNYGRK